MKLDDQLEHYDHFLIDLWGVVWDGRVVFEDTVDWIRRLLTHEKDIAFLSNCAEHTAEELLQRLQDAGLAEARLEHLATSGQAMRLWFDQNGLKDKSVYCFGRESVWENVRRAGAEPHEIPEDGLKITDNQLSDTLVIGGKKDFTWQRLRQVVTAIRAGNLRIVAPNPDRIVLRESGEVALAPSMVIEVIEAALPDVRVDYIGKPYPFLYEYGIDHIARLRAEEGKPPPEKARVLMVGDSLATDIRGANNAGIDSLLLAQGNHRDESVDALRKRARAQGAYPDYHAHQMRPDAECVVFKWNKD